MAKGSGGRLHDHALLVGHSDGVAVLSCVLSIRPFQPSPEAYISLTELWNALHPEWPRLAGVWKRIDDDAPSGGFRLLAEDGAQLIGAVDVRPANDDLDISLFAAPRAQGAVLAPLYDAMCERMQSPMVLRAYVADSRPWLLAFLQDRGFVSVQQSAYSRLDVQAFDLAPHEARVADVMQRGVQVRSLVDLGEQDADWKRTYWKLTCELLKEVPFDEEFQPPPLAKFEAQLANPDQYTPAASFVALQAGVQIAASRLKLVPGLPDHAFADLTGTLPAHRRRGFATLLKLATISHARVEGIRWIVTMNDVDNPMLLLNRALGFETKHVQHTLRREKEA